MYPVEIEVYLFGVRVRLDKGKCLRDETKASFDLIINLVNSYEHYTKLCTPQHGKLITVTHNIVFNL